jgi:hypothetical protein
VNAPHLPPRFDAWAEQAFREVVSTDIPADVLARLAEPAEVFADEAHVLAVHWHPEHVPLDVIRRRVEATFPNATDSLIIPTQHNELVTWGAFAGAEVDAYSPEFRRKVQLLVHLTAERAAKATALQALLAHTYRYRATQLFDLLDTLVEPAHEPRRQAAARQAFVDPDTVALAGALAGELRRRLRENETSTPPIVLKNKLVRAWFDQARGRLGDAAIDRAQAWLKATKVLVKGGFDPRYFFETRAVLEEARAAGAGILVPHPEQFWPVLLADYDVDGYEVWNPASSEYTDFLIHAVERLNRHRERPARPMLVTMGDDAHLGEKARPPERQDPTKAGREVGVQPGWRDPAVRRALDELSVSKQKVMREYRSRLV